jgi:hypothetical protein
MSLIDLLGDFLQPIADMVPRIEQRPSTAEWLVVDGCLGVYTTRKPVGYVPALTHVERWPKVEYPVDLGLQRVLTADGQAVAANGTVIIKVTDPLACRERVGHDGWEECIAQLIRGEVTDVLTSHNLSQLTDSSRDLIWEVVADLLVWYGVEVVAITLEDFTTCFPVTMLG